MSKSRHTEAEMIGALKQLEAGRKAEDVAREVGVSKHTIYAWKAKYGGMDVSQAQEARWTKIEAGKKGSTFCREMLRRGLGLPIRRLPMQSIRMVYQIFQNNFNFLA
ncbi:MAG: hypothetical protein NVS9B5_36480 [Terriglobales bacterium]